MLITMETTTLIAVGFGLTAGIGWGVSGFFDAKASKAVGPLASAFLVNVIIAIAYALLFAVFWRHELHTANPSFTYGATYAAVSGFIITVGAVAYFKGLARGPVALVSPMSSSYPLITVALALVLFDAHLHGAQLLAIGAIIVGIMLTTNLIKPRQLRALESRGPLLGLIASICWGVGYTLLAQGILRLGWHVATLIEFGAMALAFAVCIPVVNRGAFLPFHAIRSGLKNNNVLLASSIALCAALSFNIGLSHDVAAGAIVATLSACYPVLTMLLALRSFNETVHKAQLAGAVMSMAGIVAMLAL